MVFIICMLIAIAAFVAATRLKQVPGGRLGAIAAGLVFLGISVAQMVNVVPAGHVGVVDVFGSVSDNTLKPGVNFINPFARVIHFSGKTQEIKEIADVPSKEGLSVQLEVSLLYHVDPEMANEVYKKVGENYVDVILAPIFRSVTRGVTAEYDARALYTSEREILAQRIQQELSKQVNPRGIIVESTPLRKVQLPPKLTEAIEEKLRAEQESQRMEFILTKEEQEAERKRIEAKGIADFQEIVSKGIDENLLRWKGIEATEALASSNNTKVVVVGNPKDGLPIILGDQ